MRIMFNADEVYFKALEEIFENGERTKNRTEHSTISLNGLMMKFDLARFPLLTTKHMSFSTIARELLWMIKGYTSSKDLEKHGVKIWKANSTREFLDKRGLCYNEVGDLGPIYGFQWRHFGAEYFTPKVTDEYTNDGIDQLSNVVKELKENPTSRRILMTAWNPKDLDKMALPPCHFTVQFIVNNGKLTTILYQRSGDMGLGIPYNIASYALLNYIISHVTNLKPGMLVMMIGNAHIYENHIVQLKEQMKRESFESPVLKIHKDFVKDIDDIVFEDLELNNYQSHDRIYMEMAV